MVFAKKQNNLNVGFDLFQDHGGKSDDALFNFTILNEDDLPPAFIIPDCDSSCTPSYKAIVSSGYMVIHLFFFYISESFFTRKIKLKKCIEIDTCCIM